MTNEESVTRQAFLAVPREAAWRAITDPTRIGDWLGPGAVLDPRPRGEVACCRSDGTPVRGVVVSVTSPARLVLIWAPESRPSEESSPPTRVEIVLTPEGDGTLLTIRESAAGGAWAGMMREGGELRPQALARA